MGEGRIARRVRVLAFVACTASAAGDVRAQPSPEVAQPSANGSVSAPRTPGSRHSDVAIRVLGDLEDVWAGLTPDGKGFAPAVLVLYTRSTRSACGTFADSADPHYCPLDRRIYFDPEAKPKGAPWQGEADLAIAFAMARAFGQHVQNLLGVTGRVAQPSGQPNASSARAMAVRAELQATCYAGVWFFYVELRKLLEPGELEAAAKLAANDGNAVATPADRPTGGGAFPRATAQQRERWFHKGAASGDPRLCDTFTVPSL